MAIPSHPRKGYNRIDKQSTTGYTYIGGSIILGKFLADRNESAGKVGSRWFVIASPLLFPVAYDNDEYIFLAIRFMDRRNSAT